MYGKQKYDDCDKMVMDEDESENGENPFSVHPKRPPFSVITMPLNSGSATNPRCDATIIIKGRKRLF